MERVSKNGVEWRKLNSNSTRLHVMALKLTNRLAVCVSGTGANVNASNLNWVGSRGREWGQGLGIWYIRMILDPEQKQVLNSALDLQADEALRFRSVKKHFQFPRHTQARSFCQLLVLLLICRAIRFPFPQPFSTLKAFCIGKNAKQKL